MKKLLLSATAVIALSLAGLPYYMGKKAEESLTQQEKLLSETSFLTVESHHYNRGWFSSTETTVIRLKPTLLHNIQHYLPNNLKTVLNEPITLVNHIKHGPFAGGFTPIRAQVDTEIQYTPEVAKVLARFFGNQTPLTIHNTVFLNGNGSISLNVPAFDYEELSGIKLNWEGLSGHTNYQANFNHYTNNYTAPALNVKLADQGNINFKGLDLHTETGSGNNQLSLGNSTIKLDQLSVQWKQGIDYNVKLNELVNLITNLQIGAFINPTGTIAPSNITVNQLQFATQTEENGEWVNSRGHFQFNKLAYGKDNYGPLNIDISAEHLDSKGLLAIKNKLAELANQNLSQQQIQDALLQTAKTDGVSLFTQNPVLKVNTFTFTLPQGKIDVKGQMSFHGLQASDMNDITNMLKKTQAQFDMQVPQKLLEQLAINQARSIFSVNPEDAAEGRANIDDINETLRLMVDSTISTMQRDGYLSENNGNITTHIDLSNSQLKLNGKVFQTEPEDETFDDTTPELALPTNEPQAASAAQ